jgi:hypothetical protein
MAHTSKRGISIRQTAVEETSSCVPSMLMLIEAPLSAKQFRLNRGYRGNQAPMIDGLLCLGSDLLLPSVGNTLVSVVILSLRPPSPRVSLSIDAFR